MEVGVGREGYRGYGGKVRVVTGCDAAAGHWWQGEIGREVMRVSEGICRGAERGRELRY